jgi:transcriptional regulator with XRE-family HTH domain
MTQEALAERAGLSARAIGDLECGVNRTPQPGTLLLLAEALQLSAEERAQFEAAARREKLERRPVSTPGASSDSDTASTASEIVAPLSFLALTGGEALLLEGV